MDAMGDNLIGQVLDQIQQRFTSMWDWLWDPLWQWYFLAFIAFLAIMVVAYFLPFKWVRAGLGAVLALIVAFVAGGRQMRKTYKERLEQEREKRRKLEEEKRQQRRDSGGGGGGWPFRW